MLFNSLWIVDLCRIYGVVYFNEINMYEVKWRVGKRVITSIMALPLDQIKSTYGAVKVKKLPELKRKGADRELSKWWDTNVRLNWSNGARPMK